MSKYQEQNLALRDRIFEVQTRMQKIVDKYKELVGALQLIESERASLMTKSTENQKKFDVCVTDNQKLYKVNLELIQEYRKKGVWDALLQKEPVTQLKRVQIENTVQSYTDRIDALKTVDQ